MAYTALLLVKDFNSKEFSIDYTFMTNADIPTEAFRDLISDPVNPSTGNKVTNERKNDPEQIGMGTNWMVNVNNGTTFSKPFTVTLKNHNILDPDNWTFGD